MEPVIIVEATKARLLATIEHLEVQATTFPRKLVKLHYDEEDLTDYVVSLTFEGSQAVVTCELPHNYARAPSRQPGDPLAHLWGKPLHGITELGEDFEAMAAHAVSISMGIGYENLADRVTITAEHWRLTSETPCLWAGRLTGGLAGRIGNLDLHVGSENSGYFSRNHYGLRGSSWTYFLLKRDKKQLDNTLVVDTSGKPLDYDTLNGELLALGYCLGRPVSCHLLIGLDMHGRPVAYAGGGYGFERLQPNHEYAPVPDESFKPWFTLLFQHLTKKLVSTPQFDERSHYLYETIHLYVESASELYGSSREVKALLACLAMARWFVGRDRVLVNSPEKWRRWAEGGHLLRTHAAPGYEAQLRARIEEAAQLGPVELVQLALQRAKLPNNMELLSAVRSSSELLTELVIRADYADTQARCLRLRTLCAGLLAVAVGYRGPLTGWQANRYLGLRDMTWFIPDEEARPLYFQVHTVSRLPSTHASELWPAFVRPAVPENSLVSIVEKFAQNLAPSTGGQVQARVVPLPTFDEQEARLYDFTLQSVPVPLASTVLFTIRQTTLGAALDVLNWEEEVEPIASERALTSFLSEVARATRTRHSIERLLLLTPESH